MNFKMEKIKSSKILHGVLGLLILIAVVYISYSGYSKRGSYLWVALSHPIETFVFRHPPEKQHCMPQSLGGSDFTTAYWSRSNHTVSDRWRNRPYLSDSSPNRTLLFGKPSNYKQVMIASKMGRYGLPYSVFFHHYNRDDSRLVSSEFGGTAILVYGWSWFLHIPGKC